jgi:hypothetical protein
VAVQAGRTHHFVFSSTVECSELSGPHFDFDRTFIRPDGMDALGSIAGKMLTRTGKKGAIFGHTDTVGDEAYHKKLMGGGHASELPAGLAGRSGAPGYPRCGWNAYH